MSALRHFAAHLADDQREALYGLRNAFTHDFSLIHQRGATNFRFHLTSDVDDGVVNVAAEVWDGDLTRPPASTVTIVSLPSLGDLVEAIVSTVRALADRDELEIALGGGALELASRYGFTYQRGGQ